MLKLYGEVLKVKKSKYQIKYFLEFFTIILRFVSKNFSSVFLTNYNE